MPKKITIILSDEDHKRFVVAKMDRKAKSLQALMIEATERIIGGQKSSDQETDKSVSPSATGPDSNPALSPAPIERPGQSDKLSLSPSEEEAVELLLRILRYGSEIRQKAIISNLHAFAEDVGPQQARTHGNPEQTGDLSQTLSDLIRACETIDADEGTRRKWLANLKRFKEELGGLRGESAKLRKGDRKGRG